MHVAAYIKSMGGGFEKSSVKQHLAAIRMLFDWLVVGEVVATNPANSVRGPKHVVKRGKTPVLTADQARELLDSIDVSTVVGQRDRALIASWPTASPASALPSPCASRTISRPASAGGCAFMKRVANGTKCRRTTNWKPISTPICTRPGSRARRRPAAIAPHQRFGGHSRPVPLRDR
jgi:hypothetical protein